MAVRFKKIVIEAPIWKRGFAFILDYFIINSLILFPFNNLVDRIVKPESLSDVWALMSGHGVDIGSLVYLSIIMGIFGLLYFAIIETRYQTIGKILFKINAIDIDKNIAGSGISFWRLVLRNAQIFFMYAMPLVTLVDVAWIYFNPGRQRLFEVLSRTKTVQTDII